MQDQPYIPLPSLAGLERQPFKSEPGGLHWVFTCRWTDGTLELTTGSIKVLWVFYRSLEGFLGSRVLSKALSRLKTGLEVPISPISFPTLVSAGVGRFREVGD